MHTYQLFAGSDMVQKGPTPPRPAQEQGAVRESIIVCRSLTCPIAMLTFIVCPAGIDTLTIHVTVHHIQHAVRLPLLNGTAIILVKCDCRSGCATIMMLTLHKLIGAHV